MPSYGHRLSASEARITLSLSPQACLGELTSQRDRIRKRVRRKNGVMRAPAPAGFPQGE